MVPVALPKRHDRALVTLHPDRVEKVFRSPGAALKEALFYREFSWATPRLLDFDGLTLTIERLPVAVEDSSWRPIEATREMLRALFALRVHHRDVHAKNLVRGPNGPLLIDWETAIRVDAPASYDLEGPDVSGVPKPVEHDGFQAQWWDSGATRFALGRWWA